MASCLLIPETYSFLSNAQDILDGESNKENIFISVIVFDHLYPELNFESEKRNASCISSILKMNILPSQMGLGTGNKRWKAEEFSRKFTTPRIIPHTVRSSVAEREAREVMASGTSAAPSFIIK